MATIIIIAIAVTGIEANPCTAAGTRCAICPGVFIGSTVPHSNTADPGEEKEVGLMPTGSRPQLIILPVILAALATVMVGSPAGAQYLRIIPVPPNVVAQWTPMPDLPQVFYAPNIPTDVFRYRGRYYFYWAGTWYQSKKIKGPWTLAQQPPSILSRIQTTYFKTLPRTDVQPPEAAAPGAPPAEGLMIAPDGKPAAPPPEATSPAAPETTAPPPETQESAPQAVPEGPMPKAM